MLCVGFFNFFVLCRYVCDAIWRQSFSPGKMSDEGGVNISLSNKVLSKQLKRKASDFLSSRKNANNLVDIIQCLEVSFVREMCI